LELADFANAINATKLPQTFASLVLRSHQARTDARRTEIAATAATVPPCHCRPQTVIRRDAILGVRLCL